MAIAHKLIGAQTVLDEPLPTAQVLKWEKTSGNLSLIHAMEILDMAGPYTTASPWEIEDYHGIRRIDAFGYSALPFGDRDPELVEFLREFLERDRTQSLPQQSASVWRAALAHNLITLLADFAPSHADSEVHFASTGAEAVENGVKFMRAARPGARYLISFEGAYHGLTWMAMSLTGNREYQQPFEPLVPEVIHLPFGDYDAFEATIRGLGARNVAGVVLEPIQGEAGVIIPPSGYLRALGDVCRFHGILILADEIQVGLGRTGHWFESLAQGLEPDILTLGKHLSGGLVPIGVTIARRKLCQRVLAGLGCGRLASTYSGGALALAIGVKSLEMLMERDLPARAARLGGLGLNRLRALQAARPDLLDAVRGAGLLYAMQFHPVVPAAWAHGQEELVGELSGAVGESLLHHAGVEGCLSLNDKRIVRLTPALTIPEDLFETMLQRIERLADRNHPAWHMLLHTHLHTLIGLADMARAG
jgi:acetylornithine/succinyldiaminopimelate/putrescine aminotransferase